MTRLSEAQIADVLARADLRQIAEQGGAVLRAKGLRFVGSCPLCGGGPRASRFEIEGGRWVCAVCEDGGDAIKLLRRRLNCDFVAAVEMLGGARTLTPEDESREREARARREAEERARQEAYRRREMERCLDLWSRGRRPTADRLGVYLRGRGVMLPASAVIREIDRLGFYDGEEEDARGRSRPKLIAETPAMLALFFDPRGEPCGLHITHLADDWSRKAAFRDEDGEAINAKKMRGAKKGAHLVLREVAPGQPCRLFLAEGIETCLSVATALQATGALRPTDRFWAAGDLGNLGGKATGTVAHPTLKTPAGRAQRVPDAEPDRASPGIVIPDCVTDLVMLGDGDSEPFATDLAMRRGRARYARPGLRVAVAMAAPGMDFNDMAQADFGRADATQLQESAA